MIAEYHQIVPKYIDCTFAPLENITAYELAKLLPYFLPGAGGITEDAWNAMGFEKRHLKRL